MVRPRLLAVLALAALVHGLAGLAAAPAGAEETVRQSQTVSFTTTPPSGEDWFYGSAGPSNPGYVANATATSGLDVVYSVAPESAGVCLINHGDEFPHPPYGPGAPIWFVGPGTCTVNADQPGNDDYLPAPRVSQSFVIDKAPSDFLPVKAVKRLGSPSTFTATLRIPEQQGSFWVGMRGYPGQIVTFEVGGAAVCSATTNADGSATCQATLGPIATLLNLRFTARYAGDARYTPASKSALFSLA